MGSETSEPYLPLPHSERVVSMPIVNPQTGGKSKSFRYVGLVDLHVGETIRDYKGVSDIDRFIQQAMIGYQGERYALALMHEGYTIRKVEYCLITRPSILYKHPSVSWAVVKKGNKTACKLFRAANAETKGDAAHYMAERRAKDGAGEYSIEERTSGNPTRQHYEDECIAWLNDTEHGQRVKPHSHYLNDYKLLQARWSIHNAAKHILYCRVNDRWQTNDRACHAFNRECPYLDLCVALQNGRGTETLIHEEFTTRKRNPELFGHDVGEGLPILTHSMIQDLSCNMLYYWKHERCLEKKRVADNEPLWIGSAIHIALDILNKTGDFNAAFIAINEWAEENPLHGEDAEWIKDQQIARAGAMVRVAADRWLTGDRGGETAGGQ